MKVAILFLLVGLATSNNVSNKELEEIVDKAIADFKKKPDEPYSAADFKKSIQGSSVSITGIKFQGLDTLQRSGPIKKSDGNGYKIIETQVKTSRLTASGYIKVKIQSKEVFNQAGTVTADSVTADVKFRLVDGSDKPLLLAFQKFDQVKVDNANIPGLPSTASKVIGVLSDFFTGVLARVFKR